MVTVYQNPGRFTRIQISGLFDGNRRLAVSHFISARLIGKICKYNAVQTHIRNRIQHIFSKCTAVPILDMTVLFWNCNCLVCKIPDKAALETWIFINVIPEFLEVSITVALCICILAHDKRTKIGVIRHNIFQPAHRWVHRADNIRNVPFRISGFILYISGLIIFTDPAMHRCVVCTCAGFISK